MKKILVFMLTLVMLLSFTACGGKDNEASEQSGSDTKEATAPESNAGEDSKVEEKSEAEDNSEVEFVTMNFGYITMKVPNVFGDVTEANGVYVSAGPDASITVSPAMKVTALPEQWNENELEGTLPAAYGSAFTNLELGAFDNNVNMNGNAAVYYGLYGTSSAGKEYLVQVVTLYNADLTAQYTISLIHASGDEFFTAEVGSEILNSITLAEEAQNLVAEG